jgi:CubicO group peptidase (beta-lactamase class C family)
MIGISRQARSLGFAALVLLLCCLGMGRAQAPSATQASSTSPAQSDGGTAVAQLSAGDVESFLNDIVPQKLEQASIAGMVVSVVKDGKIIAAKGYGYADVKSKRPMSPDETVVRPGSIAKLFTWTAIMQQVERGHLDLDCDINDYLDFKIPEAFGRPITLRNIMTHRSGFADIYKQFITYKPERIVSLSSYVRNNIPPRIYPPGERVAYSNYAAALAGYIVERTSGHPFADYIAKNIFAPLGMTNSSFVQPLPAELQDKLASAYVMASSSAAKPYEFTSATPTGALASTAEDMARFMIAQTQNGEAGDKRILDSNTLRLMQSHQTDEVPGLSGFALGFIDQTRNGHRVIGHPGNTQFWHSDLQLIPDAQVGIFMSVNSTGWGGGYLSVFTSLFRAFLDRYFQYKAPSEQTAETASLDARRVTGRYFSSRRTESSFLSVMNLVPAMIVTANSDATIDVTILSGLDNRRIRWREVGRLVYREEGGQARMAFVTDSAGGINYAATDKDPTAIFERSTAMRNWILRLLAIAVLILIIVLIIWPISFVVRVYGKGERFAIHNSFERLMWRMSRLSCLMWLITLVAWGSLFANAASDVTIFSEPLATKLYVLYIVTVISIAGTGLAVANCIVAWATSRQKLLGRLANSAIAIAAVYLAWFAVAFNLASFATNC